MKKEFLSVLMPRLILAVVSIVGIGVIFGSLGYFLTIPKSEFVVDDKVKETGKQEQKLTNAQQVLLSDEEVYEILKEFSIVDSTLFSERMEKYDKILANVLEFKNDITKEEMIKIEKNLEEESKTI